MQGGTVGATAHKREGGRVTLAVRNPLVEQTLLGSNIPLDATHLEDARRWGNALLMARDAWADSNRHGRRYSDREAAGSLVRRAHDTGRNGR